MMAELANRSGFTQSYVRDWFRVGKPQAIIEEKVLELLREQAEKMKEAKALLK